MENIKNIFNSIKLYFEQSQFSPQEMLIFVAIGFICLFIVRWFSLWFWKTNRQLNYLKSIDGRIKGLEEVGVRIAQENIENNSNPETNDEVNEPEEMHENSEIRVSSTEEDPVKDDSLGKRGYNVSKSGRVYSQEEIESIIRD